MPGGCGELPRPYHCRQGGDRRANRGKPRNRAERNGTKRKVSESYGKLRKVTERNGKFRDRPEIRKSMCVNVFQVPSRESGFAESPTCLPVRQALHSYGDGAATPDKPRELDRQQATGNGQQEICPGSVPPAFLLLPRCQVPGACCLSSPRVPSKRPGKVGDQTEPSGKGPSRAERNGTKRKVSESCGKKRNVSQPPRNP